jgi:hypothetical protein
LQKSVARDTGERLRVGGVAHNVECDSGRGVCLVLRAPPSRGDIGYATGHEVVAGRFDACLAGREAVSRRQSMQDPTEPIYR